MRTAASKQVVCAVAELAAGERREVDVGQRHSVVVFNVGGDYYALRNVCPHLGGALGRGRIRPLIVGEQPGGYQFGREGEILRCPYHQWEFDIKTGCALYQPGLCAKTYRVAREDDQVVLYL